jgi:hypothetical protein
MAKKNKPEYFDVEKFCAAVNSMIDSLPTESGKQELSASLRRITEFLLDLQNRFAAVPSREEAENVRSTLAIVQEFARQAKESAAVALALGHAIPRPRPAHAKPIDEDAQARAKDAVVSLEPLSVDEVRLALMDQNRYSIRDLQGIAAELGIRFTQKTNRESLVRLIATGISNFRGYQGLGGGPGMPPIMT